MFYLIERIENQLQTTNVIEVLKVRQPALRGEAKGGYRARIYETDF